MSKINRSIFWYGIACMIFGVNIQLLMTQWMLLGKPTILGVLIVIVLFFLTSLGRHNLSEAIKLNRQTEAPITIEALEVEVISEACPPHKWTTKDESNKMFCTVCGRPAGDT